MNSPFVQEQARQVAARQEVASGNAEQRASQLYRIVLGRTATSDETARIVRFTEEVAALAQPVPTWQYGTADFDPTTGKVKSFTPFRHWTGSAWQASAKFPDEKLGHAILRNNSGHAGRDVTKTTTIRWTAPQDGVVTLRGALKHDAKEGDGVTAVAISSRSGKLGNWTSHNGVKRTDLDRIEVRRGDSIDLVVEPGKSGNHDSFSWSPEFRLVEAQTPIAWNYEKDFRGPTPPAMNGWELAAQVLMMSNEFMFVD
jgi:hypothetical protein